jgi:hypothetical protein
MMESLLFFLLTRAACAYNSSYMNPYLNRVMIQNPDHFYGRRRELSRIFSRIGVEHPPSLSR